jgi:DNA-binding MarR family transcriptional regulator
MSELADALVVTMGGLTPHMDKLVEKGFVKRFRDEERDRRLVLVEVTEDGKNVLHDTKDLFLNTLRQYLKNFSEEQQEKIKQAVNTLRETLNL